MKSLTLAIVGRANVGKSTLFNCLTRSRNALVADKEGLTRDRLYGNCVLEGIPYQVIDTCGVDGEQNEELSHFMDRQVQNALVEADCVLMMVDGQKGLLAEDISLAKKLRIANKKTYVVVNKTEGKEPLFTCAEFYALGFDKVFAISAAHNQGILTMMEEVAQDNQLTAPEEPTSSGDVGLKIAVLGRPNVGKSTLINRLLQEDRVVVFDMPGTTRDSIYIPFKRHQKHYTLIDTAGVRRKSRVSDVVEKFSAIKTLQAMQDADCVILVLNAHEDLYDQDLNLLRRIVKIGRAVVIAVNKWDGLSTEARDQFKEKLKQKLQFLSKVRIHTISALHGTGVGDLFDLVEEAHQSANQELSSTFLSKILEKAVSAHPPPLSHARRIRLKYAHSVGTNPLRILIHGNQTEFLPEHYKKYLHNIFTKELKVVGASLQIVFRTAENPFKDKRNTLTPRQLQKRKRLMRFAKKH